MRSRLVGDAAIVNRMITNLADIAPQSTVYPLLAVALFVLIVTAVIVLVVVLIRRRRRSGPPPPPGPPGPPPR